MRILGLDISTKCTGYCLIIDNKITIHGYIDMGKITDTSERMRKMAGKLIEIILAADPDVFYVEDTWMSNNPDTMSKLDMLIGVAYGQAVIRSKGFHKIKPTSWRSTLGLPARAKREEAKQNSINYIKEKYNLDVQEDEAEAICIATAGLILEEK